PSPRTATSSSAPSPAHDRVLLALGAAHGFKSPPSSAGSWPPSPSTATPRSTSPRSPPTAPPSPPPGRGPATWSEPRARGPRSVHEELVALGVPPAGVRQPGSGPVAAVPAEPLGQTVLDNPGKSAYHGRLC